MSEDSVVENNDRDISEVEVDVTVTINGTSKLYLDILAGSAEKDPQVIGGLLLDGILATAYASWHIGFRDGKEKRESEDDPQTATDN